MLWNCVQEIKLLKIYIHLPRLQRLLWLPEYFVLAAEPLDTKKEKTETTNQHRNHLKLIKLTKI